ncbi:MAG: N-carbamoylputrescine amidase [Myxococcales bacterium]|nr:MAG: N-carbamoylputrescine amidase [Myxococcales bacterium]
MTTLAIVQMSMTTEKKANLEKASSFVEQATKAGAQLVLLPELFLGPYFPQKESADYFSWAEHFEKSSTLQHFAKLAKQLSVVLPVSFFEKDGQSYFNSMAMINSDGAILGNYRKSHIPDGPGYEEKFFFRPGNTGFRVWNTSVGAIGVGICWDQWFPEAARIMTLMGAEVLLYPTAIGSEPAEPELNTKDPWQKAMLGHAVCNVIPVAAANRVGNEEGQIFYGSSFISDFRGEKRVELDQVEENIALADFDLAQVQKERDAFGFFRDRRPELYGKLCE